ncbi:MAG: glucosamine-6-phosphate deaminase [Tissierellia bacterium]|nr:glucosamine-6-phosphate deaminase [Tissierellia bacterium]
MELIVTKDYDELSKEAANILKRDIKKYKKINLGLATGSTPIGCYKELIRLHEEEGLDFSDVVTFNLDEYIGLDSNNKNSYSYFMKENLFNHINIDLENTHIPNGKAKNLKEYCKKYDQKIEDAGGIDIQILGIGTNGHIGFNEPGDRLNINTFIVDLSENTIKDNARFFENPEDVPKKAITMGIGSILKAKKILLLANGKNKYDVIKKLLETETLDSEFPASFLKLHHDVVVIVDKDAYEK